MTRIAPFIVSFSVIAFAGAAAAAGESGQQGASAKPQQSTQSQSQAMSAKGLIGADVVDAQGKEMGEIKDVVLDLHNARVHAAVVEFGGFLGVGEKQYAFPVSELKTAKGADKLTLNVSKEKLEQQQGFDKDKWPSMNDEYWGRMGGKAAAGGTKAQGQKANLYRASELIGRNVENKDGEQVGEIRDIVLSADRAKIQSIVVSRDDGADTRIQPKQLSLGTGDKLVVDMPAAKRKQGSAAGGASSAKPASGAGSQKTFSELDKNNDGNLSRDEWDAGQNGSAGKTRQ